MPRLSNEDFYTAAIAKYGVTPRGVHWLSKEHQSVRFETILEFLPSDLSSHTLVDVGCGFGDFYLFLKQKNSLPKSYIGVDVMREMCQITKEQTAQPTLHADITKTPPPPADYIVCSGALNILTPFETELFIQNCYSSAKKGFVFNALYGSKESPTYNYLSQKQIESLSKRLHPTQTESKVGYLPNDITLGFFR